MQEIDGLETRGSCRWDREPLACGRPGGGRGPRRAPNSFLLTASQTSSPNAGHRRHGLPDRVHYKDLHRGCRDAAVGAGTDRLDASANDYLRSFRLIRRIGRRPGHGPAATDQTAGVPSGCTRHEWCARARWFGKASLWDQRLPTLGEYYRGGLRLAAEPGTIWAYTDHGFATLGEIVEDLSGQPLHRYFRENVFQPLGMTDTDLLRSQRLRPGWRAGTAGAKGERR